MGKKSGGSRDTRRYCAWWQARVRDSNRKLIGYINAGSIFVEASDTKGAISAARRQAKKILEQADRDEGEKLTPHITAIVDPTGQIHQIRRVVQGDIISRSL